MRCLLTAVAALSLPDCLCLCVLGPGAVFVREVGTLRDCLSAMWGPGLCVYVKSRHDLVVDAGRKDVRSVSSGGEGEHVGLDTSWTLRGQLLDSSARASASASCERKRLTRVPCLRGGGRCLGGVWEVSRRRLGRV